MRIDGESEQKLSRYFQENPDLRMALQNTGESKGEATDGSCPVESLGRYGDRARILGQQAVRNAHRRRRLRASLACTAAAVMLFFAVTPPGRALAVRAYHTVAQVVGGILYLNSGDIPAATQIYPFRQVEPASFGNIQDAIGYVGSPLLFAGNGSVSIENITVDSTEAFNSILTGYRTPDDKRFMIEQTIFRGADGWGASLDVAGERPFAITLFNGETMYCGYTREGYAVGLAHWGNTELYVTSTTMKWEELRSAIDNLAQASK